MICSDSSHGCVNMMYTHKSGEKGQAIPEFMVFALFVMVPVFMMIPVMGKISDMNQKSILAARYGAWERTVSSPTRKTDAVLLDEARLRFFARNNRYIQSGEAVRERDADRSRLWRTNSDRPMLARFTGTRGVSGGQNPATVTTTANARLARTGARTEDIALNIARPGSRDFRGSYDIYKSTFSVPVSTIRRQKPFDTGTDCANANSNQIYMCIRRQHAIYTDTWNAGSSVQVADRVRDMVLLSRLKWVENVLSGALGWFPWGLFRETRWLDFGIVRPDVLPRDRLGPRVNYRR